MQTRNLAAGPTPAPRCAKVDVLVKPTSGSRRWTTPAAASQSDAQLTLCSKHDPVPDATRRPQALHPAAHLAAAVAACCLTLAPPPLVPELLVGAAQAHGSHGTGAHAPANTATSRFSCTPLTPEQRTQLFGDLGGYSHKIATKSPQAQRFFDEGIMHAYDFNQPAALAAFKSAAAADPQAPAPQWGIAYALGPFLNKPAAPFEGTFPVFLPEELAAGREALTQGSQLLESQLLQQVKLKNSRSPSFDPAYFDALQRDKVYLTALAGVFNSGASYGPKWDAAQLSYARTLEAYGESHPEDKDSLVLAAEAYANTQPWDFWTSDGQPKGATPHILDLLSAGLKRDSEHPLGSHLLIHMVEASPNAGAAEAAADVIGPRYARFGHLVHMASHTYLRVGRWHDAVVSNANALEEDVRAARACVDPYGPQHNAAMLIYAASTGAELATAEKYSRDIVTYPEQYGPAYMTDGRDRSLLSVVQARFGKWGDILSVSEADVDVSQDGLMLPPTIAPRNQGALHFVRALAFAAQAAKDQASGTVLSTPGSAALTASSSGVGAPQGASLLMVSEETGAVLGSSSVLGQVEAAAPAQPAVFVAGDAPAAHVSTAPAVGSKARQQAGIEVDALAAIVAGLPDDYTTKPGNGIGIYSPGYKLELTHALHVARARLAVLDGAPEVAVKELRDAVALENIWGVAGYTEPPRFYQPQAECLGWVLLQQGRLSEAGAAYAQDLASFPRTPWALTGLRDVYAAAAKSQVNLQLPTGTPSAEQVSQLLSQLAAESQGAAVTLPTSCPAFSETA